MHKRTEKAKTLRKDGADENVCFRRSVYIYPRPPVALMALSLVDPSKRTMFLTVTAIAKSIMEAVPRCDERREG